MDAKVFFLSSAADWADEMRRAFAFSASGVDGLADLQWEHSEYCNSRVPF